MSLGIGPVVRDALGLGDTIDNPSGAYIVGTVAGIIVQALIMGGAGEGGGGGGEGIGGLPPEGGIPPSASGAGSNVTAPIEPPSGYGAGSVPLESLPDEALVCRGGPAAPIGLQAVLA